MTIINDIARDYCVEIDEYIKEINSIIAKREKIQTHINYLTIASAILPSILAPTTGIITLWSHQYWIAFFNIANVIPPILTTINKNNIEYYNKIDKYGDSIRLKRKLNNYKRHINNLAINGQLINSIDEIDAALIDFANQLDELQISTH